MGDLEASPSKPGTGFGNSVRNIAAAAAARVHDRVGADGSKAITVLIVLMAVVRAMVLKCWLFERVVMLVMMKKIVSMRLMVTTQRY